MACFLEKLLSGDHPYLAELWRAEFSHLCDEAIKGVGVESIDDRVRCLEELLSEEKARHESTRRQLDVMKFDRDGLLYKLQAARRELMT